MRYTLRRARQSDVPDILKLISSATKRGKLLPRPKKELSNVLKYYWVIVDDKNTIIASCGLEVYNKKLAEIRSLVVSEHAAGLGLGTQLVERCIREAKQRKIYEVLSITDRTNMFHRLGFSEQLHGQTALFLRP